MNPIPQATPSAPPSMPASASSMAPAMPPASPASAPATSTAPARLGLALGLLGVVIFALTLPLTRLATGTPEAPGMSGLFIASGRAVLAGLLSLAWLVLARAPWPARRQAVGLGLTAVGVVLGFPLLTSLAMREVQAVHASVIVGVLPLATAALGALLQHQRPSRGFWACAMLGSGLVVSYALLRAPGARVVLHPADLLLLAAMGCAALGYASGAQLARQMPAEQVIGWALVLSLPVTVPLAAISWPTQPQSGSAWAAFTYLAVGSMWLGFFAWYRGLALGGTVRVSQVQLAQPFLSMLFAVPLLGESLDAVTLGFGAAVFATVFVGRRMPVHADPIARP